MAGLILPGCFHYRSARSAAPAPDPIAVGAFEDRSSAEDRERLRTFAAGIGVGRLSTLERDEGSFASLPEMMRARAEAAMERGGLDVVSVRTTPSGVLVRHVPRVIVEHLGGAAEAVGDDPRVRHDVFIDSLITVAPNVRYLSARLLAQLDAEAAAIEEVRTALGEPAIERPFGGLRWTPSRVTLERLKDGIDVTVPDQVAGDAAGVVVYLPALFPNVYEYRVVDELRQRGWEMVFIDASPWIDGPNAVEIETARERQRLEFRRRIQEILDPANKEGGDRDETRQEVPDTVTIYDAAERAYPEPPTGFEWSPGTDENELGSKIAEAVDEELLDYVMAAQAALEELYERAEGLRGKPVVVLGFSGGTFGAPAIALGLRETVVDGPIALVLVGGGGDGLSVSLDSSLSRGGLNVVPLGEVLPGDVRQRLVAAYRERSRLDPLRAVASLRDVPFLKVYADADRIVPTEAARALVAAHGGADRLIFDGEHAPLFYFLPGQKARIASWVERSLQELDWRQ